MGYDDHPKPQGYGRVAIALASRRNREAVRRIEFLRGPSGRMSP